MLSTSQQKKQSDQGDSPKNQSTQQNKKSQSHNNTNDISQNYQALQSQQQFQSQSQQQTTNNPEQQIQMQDLIQCMRDCDMKILSSYLELYLKENNKVQPEELYAQLLYDFIQEVKTADQEDKIWFIREFIVNKNIDINYKNKQDDNKTILMQACSQGFLQVIDVLAQIPSINFNSTDKFGRNALFYVVASKNGDNVDVANLLLSNKVNLGTLYQNKNKTQQLSLLHMSILNDHEEIAKTIIEQANEQYINLQIKETGETALHLTVLQKNEDLIQLLSQKNANFEIKNNKNQTPQDLAKDDDKLINFIQQLKEEKKQQQQQKQNQDTHQTFSTQGIQNKQDEQKNQSQKLTNVPLQLQEQNFSDQFNNSKNSNKQQNDQINQQQQSEKDKQFTEQSDENLNQNKQEEDYDTKNEKDNQISNQNVQSEENNLNTQQNANIQQNIQKNNTEKDNIQQNDILEQKIKIQNHEQHNKLNKNQQSDFNSDENFQDNLVQKQSKKNLENQNPNEEKIKNIQLTNTDTQTQSANKGEFLDCSDDLKQLCQSNLILQDPTQYNDDEEETEKYVRMKTFIQSSSLCKHLDQEIYEFQQINEDFLKQNKPKFDELITLITQSIQKKIKCQVQIFGSYATQLCLTWSDIDLVVSHNQSSLKNQDTLAEIEQILKEQSFVKQIKRIPTASVPVIKVICTSEYLEKKIDITVSEGTHLGSECVKLVNSFLKEYKPLKPLVLVLKQLMFSSNLYDTYQGGISSYSLTLLIVTFLQLTITEWKRSALDSKVILYTVKLSKKGSPEWNLEYRYSQFDELHKQLKKLYSGMPHLPGKSLFKVTEDAQLDERRLKLQDYLRTLISRPDIFNSDSLKQFLQLDKYASEAIVNPPKLLAETSGFNHGVRDFFYESNKGALFILSGDMNVGSRVDAYMTNTKMPWEKEAPQTLVSVGALECWVRVKGESEFKFERVWTKIYPLQGICLYWDSDNNQVFVGLDEGQLNVIKVAADVDFLRYEDILDEKVHDKRVMGVFHHSLTNSTYTISEDKSLRTVVDGKVQNKITQSNSGLTSIYGDSEYKRLFVSNRSGHVFIYDISSGVPVQLNCVQTSEKGAIRSLQVDTLKNYFFTGGFDDGEIGVFQLEKPGREKFVKQTASFKGKTNIRFIEWSSSRMEIYVGTKDGTVTVWDVRQAQPIYVLKAHSKDITKLQWMEDKKILITTSKEKVIKFWKLPAEWRLKDVVEKENQEYEEEQRVKNYNRRNQNIQNANEDSDEDDLLGWHKDV
ncbi:WD40-repeat-containing domain [Pseudocohnilembus persalinus]|uniref:WD40-repeat-containing domain n=1 Tax=Pseudocohnilembus persalinus TaxID=266149 RepID=A0A0V0QT86_PSEPJ|nr:WD40-repeat-containing domain [Pseudocohnilembus persalinus]|eukprot:KRX05178.1 WD40-repeat-containing domain [Pseudocohnilembus persalinus]